MGGAGGPRLSAFTGLGGGPGHRLSLAFAFPSPLVTVTGLDLQSSALTRRPSE